MSVVTNVVLMTGLVDGEAVEALDDWLQEQGHAPMRELSSMASGHKAMEVNVYLSAHNYLDEDAFIKFATGLSWRWPEEFCLITQTEDYGRRVTTL